MTNFIFFCKYKSVELVLIRKDDKSKENAYWWYEDDNKRYNKIAVNDKNNAGIVASRKKWEYSEWARDHKRNRFMSTYDSPNIEIMK